MSKIRVSAVKYTNSIPFIYGLQNYSLEDEISLSLDTPAQCYDKLHSGNADIGLVPVIIRTKVPSIHQVSRYGIGSNGNVYSVILVSKSPLKQIKTITTDYQSKTSVVLLRLLCRDFWKINPQFAETKAGYENQELHANEARLIIGDRAFHFYNQQDVYLSDLGGEWTNFTGLPFVFAFWASIQKLSPEFEQKFSEALSFGLTHKVRLSKEMAAQPEYKNINLPKYLNENIIHEISPAMQEGMNLFLFLIRDFQ